MKLLKSTARIVTALSVMVSLIGQVSTGTVTAAEGKNYYYEVKSLILNSNYNYNDFYDINGDGVINVFDALRIQKENLKEENDMSITIKPGSIGVNDEGTIKDVDLITGNSKEYIEQSVDKWMDENIDDIKNDLKSDVNEVKREMAVQEARMDQLVGTVPEGSADEIADARVTADGRTEANLGNAIRSQVSGLKETIDELIDSIGVKSERSYDNWDELINSTPTHLIIGSSKRYESGFVNSVDVRCGKASSETVVYIVEADDRNNVIASHKYSRSTVLGDQSISIKEFFENPFYVYVGGSYLQWVAKTGTYKSGNYAEDQTSVIFPDNLQLAIGVSYNNIGSIERDIDTIKQDYTKESEFITEVGNSEELCFDGNWDYLNATADNGCWGVGKLFDAGYIKSVKIFTKSESDSSFVRFVVVDDNDNSYIREVIDVPFVSTASIQYVPVEKLIKGRFYLFASAPIAYGSFPDGAYKSTVMPSGAALWKIKFTAQYMFGMGVVRGTSRENENIIADNTVKSIKGFENLSFKPKKIVLLGDSIVQGYGSSDYDITTEVDEIPVTSEAAARSHYRNSGSKCWGNMLKNYLESTYPDVEVINNGIGGITVYELYRTISTLVDETVTDVIVSVGTNSRNDPNMERDVVQYMSYIITYCRKLDINVIVFTNTPLKNNGVKDKSVEQAIVRTCNGYNIDAVNMYNGIMYYLFDHDMQLSDIMADDLHPNDTGYKIMYNIVAKELKI